jgi:3-methyladenine DNA glycosylase AlkD
MNIKKSASLDEVRDALRAYADPEKAKFLKRFFKTGPGEYAEGDLLIGVTVPQTRSVAKKYKNLALSDQVKLLRSKIHEERLLALILMVATYVRGDEKTQKKIYETYLANLKHVNNWDLVDTSAPFIVGHYLFLRDTRVLDRLAKSKVLWERRVAILSTLYFIRQSNFEPTLRIAEKLLQDPEDLIHKAVGWMLREMGKKDLRPLKEFLATKCSKMPRTMLRYAIEKFPEKQRKAYLKGSF